MQSDEHLILAMARGGDVDAFNRLVSIHQDAVYGFSISLTRQHAVADDVTQETFISAFRSISRMRGDNVRAWLLRIARNKAYDYFRRQKRRRESSVDEDATVFRERLASDNPSPPDIAMNSELRDALERCVGTLSDEHRESNRAGRRAGAELRRRIGSVRCEHRDCEVTSEPGEAASAGLPSGHTWVVAYRIGRAGVVMLRTMERNGGKKTSFKHGSRLQQPEC